MTCRRINRWWSFAITALGVRWSSTFYETPVLTMPSTSTAASKPGPARSTEGFVTLPCGERAAPARHGAASSRGFDIWRLRREKTRRRSGVSDNMSGQATNLHGGLLRLVDSQLSVSETLLLFQTAVSYLSGPGQLRCSVALSQFAICAFGSCRAPFPSVHSPFSNGLVPSRLPHALLRALPCHVGRRPAGGFSRRCRGVRPLCCVLPWA